MAARQFMDRQFTLLKGRVELYCVVAVGAAGAVTLQKWNYPTFGGGVNARTYSAATVGPARLASAGNYPSQFAAGSEGIYSVARTAAGLWTITLQDNYQRLVGLSMFSTLTGGLSAIVGVAQNSTISSLAAPGGSVIGVALLSATATALDPASGEVVTIKFDLQNATEP